jgi:hypothetical protein
MTQFSQKTDKIIISDIKEIRSLAKEIIIDCKKCLDMMKESYVDEDDWSKLTTNIVACYKGMEYIMEEKRGRF